MNKNYTPDYKTGVIGVRFNNHDDESINKKFNPVDDDGNYIINYNSFINSDDRMMKFFEKKYDISFIKSSKTDTSFLYEYFYMFSCPEGKEEELIGKITKDKMVNHCSRIDNRIIETNSIIERVYDDLHHLDDLELDSLSDSEIDKKIDNAINSLKKIKSR